MSVGEEDIRQYLSNKTASAPPQPRTVKVVRRPRMEPESTFQNFSATHLFCPTCRLATPVREKLLLYLPDGDLYGYFCTICATSVGTRKAGGALV